MGKAKIKAEMILMSKESDNEQKVELDFGGLSKVLEEDRKANQKAMVEALNEALSKRETGKGQIIRDEERQAKIIEGFHMMAKEIEDKNVSKVSDESMKLLEQWTVVIPNYTNKETNAHLRDFVYVWDGLKGKPGDQANIPYVSDCDFQVLANVGDAFTGATTGLVSSFTTTLYEAGMWYDLPYYLIERIDQNLLEQINLMLAKAAVRAEDAMIMALVGAGTSTNFAGNVTRLSSAAFFFAANVPAALKLLLGGTKTATPWALGQLTGRDALPSECVLYLTPRMYGDLLIELVASQVIAAAVPSMIVQGQVEKYLGVSVVIGGTAVGMPRTNAATATIQHAFLMRGKRAVALAPKRELLIETDKQIVTRALRITASHTMAAKVLDFKQIVRIWTSCPWGTTKRA